MKRLNFNLLILLVLITSMASTNKYDVSVFGSDKNDVSASKPLRPTADAPEPELFVLQPEHPAYRLDGCIVRSSEANSLSFEFKRPGRSVVVIRAKAPLIIAWRMRPLIRS